MKPDEEKLFKDRLVKTDSALRALSRPNVLVPDDKAWGPFDTKISSMYRYLEDAEEDDPPWKLYLTLLEILNDDRDRNGDYTLTGLVLLIRRAEQTLRLTQEYRQLNEEEQPTLIDEEYRVVFFKRFTRDFRRWNLLKVLGEALKSRRVKRFAGREDD